MNVGTRSRGGAHDRCVIAVREIGEGFIIELVHEPARFCLRQSVPAHVWNSGVTVETLH